MEQGIIILITVLGMLLIARLFQRVLPTAVSEKWVLTDLPDLKKRYQRFHTLSILLFPLSMVSSIVAGAILIPDIDLKLDIILVLSFAVPFTVLNTIYWFSFKMKGKEWFEGLKAFLDMSYGYDYFASVRLTTTISVLGIIGFVVYKIWLE